MGWDINFQHYFNQARGLLRFFCGDFPLKNLFISLLYIILFLIYSF